MASLVLIARLAVQKQILKYFGTKWPPRDKGLFRENVHGKSRKVIWDMINTLFVTTVAVEPTFVAILCTRKHMKICPYVIYSGCQGFF